jgi:hypothetical protein
MNGKKTYLVACLMILHALTSYALGHDPALNLQEILSALGLSALRAGVKKIEKPESLGPGLVIFFAAGILSVTPLQAATEEEWDWIAPEPPLADTVYLDYGWDSTSNGVPYALAVPERRYFAPPAPPPLPGRLSVTPRFALLGSAMAQNVAMQPPPAPTIIPPPQAHPAAAPKPEGESLLRSRPKPGRFYADSFLSLRTENFTHADYGYGVGVGYQVSKHWSAEVRASHQGLDITGSAIQDLGARLVARMPFEFLSPYTFLGGSFDLERDAWHLTPGAGIELGVTKRLKGLSIFAEGGLDADLHGRSGYLFGSGIRLRF